MIDFRAIEAIRERVRLGTGIDLTPEQALEVQRALTASSASVDDMLATLRRLSQPEPGELERMVAALESIVTSKPFR